MCEYLGPNPRAWLLLTFNRAVSPWQFKNIDGAGDWVEYSDTLWNYRWQQAVNDVKPDIVEIGTVALSLCWS
jgi:hypothetical protein